MNPPPSTAVCLSINVTAKSRIIVMLVLMRDLAQRTQISVGKNVLKKALEYLFKHCTNVFSFPELNEKHYMSERVSRVSVLLMTSNIQVAILQQVVKCSFIFFCSCQLVQLKQISSHFLKTISTVFPIFKLI